VKLSDLHEKVQMSTSTGFRSNTMVDHGRIERDNDELSIGSNHFTLTYTTTDLHNFLRTRRSVRRFKPDPVADPLIETLLASATHAPSAHNRQPWRFVVVRDSFVKAQLANAMAEDFERDLRRDGVSEDKIDAQVQRSRNRMTSAPVIVMLCLDMSEMDSYPDEKRQQAERTMAMQSVAAAGLQLLLAAHAEGLGGVWVCAPLFAQETIQNTLKLSTNWEPQAMFYVGYPDSSPRSRERKDLQNVIKWL
jgi:F420 biosynthesis protein FbiB-like protein